MTISVVTMLPSKKMFYFYNGSTQCCSTQSPSILVNTLSELIKKKNSVFARNYKKEKTVRSFTIYRNQVIRMFIYHIPSQRIARNYKKENRVRASTLLTLPKGHHEKV